MTIRVVLDTSLLVGLWDNRDKWHVKSIAIQNSLRAADATIIYFDPVINEVVSVLARRLDEQKRNQQFSPLLDHSFCTVVKHHALHVRLDQLKSGHIVKWMAHLLLRSLFQTTDFP